MAKRFSEEDYFQNTTMTFGEHLEELRKVLVKAVIGLFAGFCIGLLIASYVVQFVQSPLEKALAKYYTERELQRLGDQYDDPKLVEAMRPFVAKRNIALNVIYIEAAEAARVVEALQAATEKKKQPANAAPGTSNRPAVKPVKDEASDAEMDIIAEEYLKTLPPPNPEGSMLAARVWLPVKVNVTSLSAQEAFMIWLKAALISGFVIASPYIFFQIWSFVAAGLYPHEQKYVYIYLPFSLGLFLLGASTAFFLVFDPVLTFLFKFNMSMNIDPDPRISEWIGFVLFLPLGFGIAFQLPLVMLFLNRIGIVPVRVFVDKWRIAVLVIFVLSAVLTPADPISMLAMALPLSLLYYLGIAMCIWMPSSNNPLAEEAV
jgi:sec-independent protein translocase protein TatC